MPSKLEMDFQKAMLEVYHSALTECGYRATRFLQMVRAKGDLRTAKDLLRSPEHSEGLTALCEYGRLDLSMEALVLKQPWSALFTDEELSVARRRLQSLGFLTS